MFKYLLGEKYRLTYRKGSTDYKIIEQPKSKGLV